MGYIYSIPDFSVYRPKKLNNLIKKLDYVDKSEIVITEDSFQKALNKLKEDKFLLRKDYKTLLYRLEELSALELMEEFIYKVEVFFQTHNRIYYHLKALLFSYYNLYRYKSVFNLLKIGFSMNEQWKDEITPIRNLINKSEHITDLFSNINEEFCKCNTLDEIEYKINLYMMNKGNPMLKLILTNKVLKSMDNKNINFNAKELLYITENYIAQSSYKEIFEKFLLTQSDKNLEDISLIIEEWFRYIGDNLGDPYGLGRIKWKGIDEQAINVFQQWRVAKQIGVFFTEIIGDFRRLNFWKRYTKYFYRVEYFEAYDKALLMETKDHLFIEFAKIGAMYMYSKDILSIDKIYEASLQYSKTYIKNSILRKANVSILNIKHLGQWEYKFKREFYYYNYII